MEEILSVVQMLGFSIVLMLLLGAYHYWTRGECNTGGSGGIALPRRDPLVPLPSFSSGNVKSFFQKVRLIQKANDWDDATVLRFLPTTLTGPALAAFLEGSRGNDWDLDSLERFLDETLNTSSDSIEHFQLHFSGKDA